MYYMSHFSFGSVYRNVTFGIQADTSLDLYTMESMAGEFRHAFGRRPVEMVRFAL